jgi:hypothetical protein
MGISAEDYNPEGLTVMGLHAITGIELTVGKNNNRYLQFEIRYMPSMKTGHIPGFLRFNIGFGMIF